MMWNVSVVQDRYLQSKNVNAFFGIVWIIQWLTRLNKIHEKIDNKCKGKIYF